MKLHRKPGQIDGSPFTEVYLYEHVRLDMPNEVPAPFLEIVDDLRHLDYGLTNPLQEDSCLILPADA